MSHKKKRSIIIGTLCGILLLMVVGYAAFSSVLNINGTSSINSNWNIQITSITSNTLNGDATNAKTPEGIGTLTASFEANLVSPGDSIEYTITVENKGNINAKLEKITVSDPNNEYITFETSGITEGEPLNAGSTTDLKVKITFKDIEISKMEETTTSLTLTLDYVQADSSSDTPDPAPEGTINMKGVYVQVQEEGSGLDGLYLDTYESSATQTASTEQTNMITTLENTNNTNNISKLSTVDRYVYKGANPNNYITFNNETWRILAVETDGTLKIMKKDSIENMAWDTSGSNNWASPATLNTYLNNDTEGAESYYNNLLNSNAKELIQTHSWGIGGVTYNNIDLSAQIQSENGIIWTGKIGLMSVSDYLRANTNTAKCENFKLARDNSYTCKKTNYIAPASGVIKTISTDADNPGKWFGTTLYPFNSNTSHPIHPAVYLKSNITLSGEGTSDNPYTITAN